jgi:hypothetical protein
MFFMMAFPAGGLLRDRSRAAPRALDRFHCAGVIATA